MIVRLRLQMIRKNIKKEKKGNMKVARQTINNEKDEEDGKNEKVQKNRIQKMKNKIAMILRIV